MRFKAANRCRRWLHERSELILYLPASCHFEEDLRQTIAWFAARDSNTDGRRIRRARQGYGFERCIPSNHEQHGLGEQRDPAPTLNVVDEHEHVVGIDAKLSDLDGVGRNSHEVLGDCLYAFIKGLEG